MTKQKLVEEFVEMIQYRRDIKHEAYTVSLTREYQALKALTEIPSASTNNASASRGIDKEDGWIKWEGGEQPVDDDVKVELKMYGTVMNYIGRTAPWFDPNKPIVAYRIIEPKTCEHRNFTGTIGGDTICNDCGSKQPWNKTKKKEVKLTLSEFVYSVFEGANPELSDLVDVISEYLEGLENNDD